MKLVFNRKTRKVNNLFFNIFGFDSTLYQALTAIKLWKGDMVWVTTDGIQQALLN